MIPDTSQLRCWAEIDTGALRHNAEVAGRLAGGGPECVMAVVKAGAYGHGLPLVVQALRDEIGAFAVASLKEALEVEKFSVPASECQGNSDILKGGHRTVRIYILCPALPAEMREIVRRGFIPAVSTVEEVRQFAAISDGKPAAIHVVVDTGMGRMGALPDEAAGVLRAVKASAVLTLDSVSSHFPSSDEDEVFTRDQERRFRALVAGWQAEFGPFRTHLANSAGILHYPRVPGEMVRAGLMLYGLSPLRESGDPLRPVFTWKSRITLVRKLPAGHGISYGRTFVTPHAMTVAAIAAGYGDGYPRQVSGHGASVLLRGRRCPILGRVTMDQMLIDVSDFTAPPSPGDEVLLMGCHGEDGIPPGEIARLAGTIPWHIFTGITDRTVRVESRT